MTLFKQILAGAAVLAIAVAVWAFFVPAAAPYLERAGLYDLFGLTAPGAAASDAGGRRFGGGPAQVVVAPVGSGQLNARVSSIGDGQAARSVTVRSDATGLIRALPVQPGGYVEAGALMAQLNDDAERIALERARLTVADTRRNFERLQQLSASGAVSTVQLREVELAFRSAELAVEEAEYTLAQRRIVAPIGGWVGLLAVEEGERIAAQDPIAVITDRTAIEIEFRVPERYIADLSLGMPIEVAPLSRPDDILSGEIVALDNVVDRESRTLRVQGRVANRDDDLRAGQAFSVILSFPGETLPAVDPLAIQWSSDGSFVWLARDGKAERVPVTIRQRTADRVLVEGALVAGEPVIVEGVQTLRPGSEIEIVPGATAATGAAGVAGSTGLL